MSVYRPFHENVHVLSLDIISKHDPTALKMNTLSQAQIIMLTSPCNKPLKPPLYVWKNEHFFLILAQKWILDTC